MDMTYIRGDVTSPQGDGKKIICHICNNLGLMGSGVAKAIATKWPTVRFQYLAMKPKGYVLGDIQEVPVDNGLSVVNMIGQDGVRSAWNQKPIRYLAVRDALRRLCLLAKGQEASIHMPRIGCGLAGGSWDQIAPIVNEELCEKGVTVFVYDL